MVARTCAPEELESIRAMFEELDTDHKGIISLKTLQEALDQKAMVCHPASLSVGMCTCPGGLHKYMRMARSLCQTWCL